MNLINKIKNIFKKTENTNDDFYEKELEFLVKKWAGISKWKNKLEYLITFQKFIDYNKEYCFNYNYVPYIHKNLKDLLKFYNKTVTIKEFTKYIRGEISFDNIRDYFTELSEDGINNLEMERIQNDRYYPGMTIYISNNSN